MEEVTPHTGVGIEPLTGAHTHPTVQCMTCGEGREDAATTAPNAHGHGKESRKGDEPLHIPPKERGQWGEGVTHAITRAKGVESATVSCTLMHDTCASCTLQCDATTAGNERNGDGKSERGVNGEGHIPPKGAHTTLELEPSGPGQPTCKTCALVAVKSWFEAQRRAAHARGSDGGTEECEDRSTEAAFASTR